MYLVDTFLFSLLVVLKLLQPLVKLAWRQYKQRQRHLESRLWPHQTLVTFTPRYTRNQTPQHSIARGLLAGSLVCAIFKPRHETTICMSLIYQVFCVCNILFRLIFIINVLIKK